MKYEDVLADVQEQLADIGEVSEESVCIVVPCGATRKQYQRAIEECGGENAGEKRAEVHE